MPQGKGEKERAAKEMNTLGQCGCSCGVLLVAPVLYLTRRWRDRTIKRSSNIPDGNANSGNPGHKSRGMEKVQKLHFRTKAIMLKRIKVLVIGKI